MKMGCKFDGKCDFKQIMKSIRRGSGSRDSHHVYCSMDGLCNQQCLQAPKCDAPTVDTKPPNFLFYQSKGM
jgi:hypothetical protein